MDRITYARRPPRQVLRLPSGGLLSGLRYVWWIAALGACWVAIETWGLPHLRWQYTYEKRGTGAHFTECDYIGPWGAFRRHPADGRCELIQVFRKDVAQRR